MNDFNHDGKIDGRDNAMYEQFIESEKNGDFNRPSSSSGNKSGSNGKIGLLEFIIIMVVISVIGYTVMAFAGELIATIVVIIIFIFLFAKG